VSSAASADRTEAALAARSFLLREERAKSSKAVPCHETARNELPQGFLGNARQKGGGAGDVAEEARTLHREDVEDGTGCS
jgi:hypothetical protein